MDPDAMTTLLGNAICNIDEEEYWEACQHALKSLYEVRISDEDEERGVALVMMMKEVMPRVIVVVTAVVVRMEMVMMTTTMIVRATIMRL